MPSSAIDVANSQPQPPEPSLFVAQRPQALLAARRRRGLYIPALLREKAKRIEHEYADGLARTAGILQHWADLESQGLLQQKERAIDAQFLLDVFGTALGYKPVTEGCKDYQLEREFPVPGVGTADGAVGSFAADAPRVPVAVIELKTPGVDLDADRFAGRTPVQQCWDYLTALPGCRWGILSNFTTLRLYHRDQGSRSFEEFTLQELRRPERVREFYFLLGRGGLLPTPLSPTPRAEQLLRETAERQREVGDELYQAYSGHRLELIDHLQTRHGKSLEQAIAIAQKLLDRIIFVAFCEDRGLLPDRIIRDTHERTPPLARVTNPRWRNFLDLFRAVDRGHHTLRLDRGYNGGLFEHDPEVDDLQLEDGWTDFFRNVGEYDFRDEVNVDVLGHLFEKSVTELERLRLGGLFRPPHPRESDEPKMPKSAQRKRLGIYYTPPELTALLVEQTVGALLGERFEAAAQRHSVTLAGGRAEGPEEAVRAYWGDCLAALRNLKVCDPACGSGAFLIRAYEFLEERYVEVVESLRPDGDPAAEDLAEQIPHWILNENLFGVDLSPEAVEITQLALWLRSARKGRKLDDLSANVVCGNSLVDDAAAHPLAMKWADAFPAVFGRDPPGFDVVIGNPPWERLKVQEREFFALSEPKIAEAVSAAQRRKLVARLETRNPELYARYLAAQQGAARVLDYVHASGRYPLTGKGDVNTYVLFAEMARSIVSPLGRVGLLVPSGIASDHTTRHFFNEVVDAQSLITLYDFENRRAWFPDVHRSFKFSTLVLGGSGVKTPATDFVFFAHTMEDLKPKKRHIPLTPKDLALVNPNTRTCPVFRSRRDADLTKAIYRRVPILIDRNRKKGGNPWGIKFLRMFDQTNDAELFHTAEQLKEMGFKLHGNHWKRRKQAFLPLYEAKMVQAYDHRAAGVIVDTENWMRQGQTAPTSLVAHQNPEFVVLPRWWVSEEAVGQSLQSEELPAFLCYKDVTSPTNERTMIAAFIPRAGVVNTAPLVLFDNGVPARRQCCLLANLNSFVLDFVARQKVGNVHLNFYIVEQLPILSPDAYAERCPWKSSQTLERWISDRVLKLTCTADDLRPLAQAASFREGVHKWKPDERAQLLAELDAAYFLLYGLERDDVEYVLSTFKGVRRRDTVETGEYRTERLILAAYDALKK